MPNDAVRIDCFGEGTTLPNRVRRTRGEVVMLYLDQPFTQAIDQLLLGVAHKLQLSPTQYEKAESAYETIAGWLAKDEGVLGRANPRIFPQGSIRIRTPVKPIGQNEFDCDAVCELDIGTPPHPLWTLDLIENRLKAHGTYEGRLERKNRCIRVLYEGDFYLDILPARPFGPAGFLKVPDRDTRGEKDSAPRLYAEWFDRQTLRRARLMNEDRAEVIPLPEQTSVREKGVLRVAVQLIKRHRDIAFQKDQDNAPISIVLTTLAAHFFDGQDSPFAAVTSILESIIRIVPGSGAPFSVWNPVHPGEDLSERWKANPEAYQKFVLWIGEFYRKWKRLGELRGPDLTLALEGLFGETVHAVIRDQLESVGEHRTARTLGVNRVGGLTLGAVGANSYIVKPQTFYGA